MNNDRLIKRLLLVEDECSHAELIIRAFESSQDEWEIVRTSSLEEARAWLNEHTPEVVLADFKLPDGRGDALVESSHGAYPVVLLTAFGSERVAVDVIKAGALDYLVKSPEAFEDMPFRVKRVIAEWKRLLAHRKAEDRLQRLTRTLLQLSPDHQRNLQSLTSLAGDLLDARFAFFGRFEGGDLLLVGKWQLPASFPSKSGLARLFHRVQETGGEQNDLLVLPLDVSPNMSLRALLGGEPVKTCLAHLVRDPGGAVGVVAVFLEQEHQPNENDRHTLGLLASALRVEEARWRAEQALAYSEAQFRAVWDRSKDGMRLVDGRGSILRVNQAYCEMVGRSEDELMGKPFSIPFADEHASDLLSDFREVYRRRHFVGLMQASLRLRDGRVVWLEKASTLLDPASEEPLVLDLIRDVTERQVAQEKLRQSEERFRALLQSIHSVAVLGYTPEGKIQYWNRGSELLYQFTADEVLGRDVIELIVPASQRVKARDLIQQMVQGGRTVPSAELEMLRKNGSLVPVLSSHAVVAQQDGPPLLFCVGVDLTRQREAESERLGMERQLLHGQKLESLGVLAGGIAHDFNNLLTSMLGNIGLALMDLPEHAPARRSIMEAEKAVRRAADLTRQMLAYSGRGMFQVRVLDLSEVVREMAQLLKVTIPKTAILRMELNSELPSVRADAAQVQQVIMNLITNASEAIGDQAGSITVTTSSREYEEGYLAGSRLTEKPKAGRFVCLEVADTGCGMDETVQQRLFDPFFTTKFTGRGLGMSAVLGVVRGHKGAIFVHSQPKAGTKIQVLFPAGSDLVPPKKTSARSELPAPMPGRSQGVVLVADDEVQVRLLAERALTRAGFQVLSAGDGLEAVKLLDANANRVECAILDLTMPGLDGVKTFQEMRRVNPQLKAILASGYDQHELRGRYDGLGFAAFVQKPFEITRLVEKVRQLVMEQVSATSGSK